MKGYVFLGVVAVISVLLIAYAIGITVHDIQQTALEREAKELEAHRKEMFARTENFKF